MYENIKVEDNRISDATEISLCSGIGGRDCQQDGAYFYADDNILYAVVCDGMGGLGGGERASSKALEIAELNVQKYVEEINNNSITEPDENAEKEDDLLQTEICNYQWMADAIMKADKAVYSLCDRSGRRLGAGTTFASVCISDHKLFWASVGDSRVYLFHGEEVAQLTTDLNYSFVLDIKLLNGEISETEYEKELIDGEALTTFVGLGAIDIIDRNLEPLPLTNGDIIVICTDGLYRTIDANWLGEILSYNNTLDDAARMIDQIIHEKRGPYQDNYTCFMIKIDDLIKEKC